MSSPPLVSIHITVSHPASSVLPTLQSLGTQTQPSLQLLLVDNASQDIEIPWTRGLGPEVMVLRNFRDQGFAHAHNQALTSLFARWDPLSWEQRYIILASSSILFAPDTVEHLIQTLEANPDLMAVSPKVRRAALEVSEDSDEPRWIDTGVLEQAGIRWTGALEPVDRGRGEEDAGQCDQLESKQGIGTWCIALRASALMKAKLGEEWLDADLPETYAMADLAWRLQTLQVSTRLAPQALVWVRHATVPPSGIYARLRHWYGQQDLQERRLRSYACLLRLKNAAWGSMILALPWLILTWIQRMGAFLLDPRVASAIARSWLLIPHALRKRTFLHLAIRQSRR